MSSNPNITYAIRYGPSLDSRFAAVVAEFSIPFADSISREQFVSRAISLIGENTEELNVETNEVNFHTAVLCIVRCFLDFGGRCNLSISSEQIDEHRVRLAVGYYDAQATMQACDTALRTSFAIFSPEEDAAKLRPVVVELIQQAKNAVIYRHPDYIAQALIRVARKRDIPVCSIAPGSRTWRYGQGSAGINFIEAANEQDSMPGAQLASDKFQSNQLITRLGLPGVLHANAETPEQAQQIADRLGYPVVVKPRFGGKGRGITANVMNEAELQRAYQKCKRETSQPILVEAAIPGDDHRMVVIGGKFKWAVRRRSPRITGDGQQTIRELIAAENHQRADADVAAGFVSRLVIDSDMETVLAKQGLVVDDIPQANRNVTLRSVANTATGGTIEDFTEQVHPDNISMVETIARAFRIDTIGVDFITTDITESWCANHSAVIEINTTPGFSSDNRAETILDAKFAKGNQGRIPIVALIDCSSEVRRSVVGLFEKHGLNTGYSDTETTHLGHAPRVKSKMNLAARITSLILDPGCDGVIFSESTANVEAHGFPMDRADLILVGNENDRENVSDLLARCAPCVIDRVNNAEFADKPIAQIETILATYAELKRQ